MRAAIDALPFEPPKLAVTASFNGEDFADQMDKAFRRSAKVIEAEPIALPNRCDLRRWCLIADFEGPNVKKRPDWALCRSVMVVYSYKVFILSTPERL